VVSKLEKMIKKRPITQKDDLSPELLQQVREAIVLSPNTPNGMVTTCKQLSFGMTG